MQACVVVYRNPNGVYGYQGLLAVSYKADVTGGTDSLAGRIWANHCKHTADSRRIWIRA